MTLLFVVEGADVVCRRRAEFNNCGRFLPIPRLCLHFCPELLDQGIVVTVTENPKAESEAVFLSVARERSRRELHAMLGESDAALVGFTC